MTWTDRFNMLRFIVSVAGICLAALIIGLALGIAIIEKRREKKRRLLEGKGPITPED